MLKEKLREAFFDTLNRCENDTYLKPYVEKSKQNTIIYTENEAITTTDFPVYNGDIKVINKKIIESVEEEHTAILNFASAVMIGGEPWRGYLTQEEVICRSTTLYPTLNQPHIIAGYYNYFKNNVKDIYYTDRMIISKDVLIIKTDDLIPQPLLKEDYLKIDVITSPAPLILRDFSNFDEQKYKDTYTSRIRQILKLAALYKNTTIILGAFGCGAFNNPPEIAANCFKHVLYEENYKDYFKNVVFAIPILNNDDTNYKIFKEILC